MVAISGKIERKKDNNEGIKNEDKHQYLLQANLKSSRAQKIVELYYAINDSYENVIECSKAHFGRTYILIGV